MLLETTAGRRLDRAPDAVAQELHGWTKGNPFFLAETVRHCRRDGRHLDTSRAGSTGSTSPRASSRSSGAGSRAWATTRPPAELRGRHRARVRPRRPLRGRRHQDQEAPGLDALDVSTGRQGRAGRGAPRATRRAATRSSTRSWCERSRRSSRAGAGAPHAPARRRGARGEAHRRRCARRWATSPTTGPRPSARGGQRRRGTPAHAKAVEFAVRAGRTALAQLAPDEALRWFEDGSCPARRRAGPGRDAP